jgi:hypothetical protein
MTALLKPKSDLAVGIIEFNTHKSKRLGNLSHSRTRLAEFSIEILP